MSISEPQSEAVFPALPEGADQALAKVHDIMLRTLTRFRDINLRLAEIEDETKAAQPKKPGAVLLGVYKCGKNCLGCPHPRWTKWYSDKRTAGVMPQFKCYTLKGDPALALTRSGAFEPGYPTMLELVREVKALVKERSELIELLQLLRAKAG